MSPRELEVQGEEAQKSHKDSLDTVESRLENVQGLLGKLCVSTSSRQAVH